MDNVQESEALQVIQICAWSMRTVNSLSESKTPFEFLAMNNNGANLRVQTGETQPLRQSRL